MTTPYAAAAGAARQRLSNTLGPLQANPQLPPAIAEILEGLARAMGPLFQLERGSADLALFQTARAVLQETLARIQTVDQNNPAVPEATAAVAEALGVIFKAMREAGIAPPPAGGPASPQAQPQAQPQAMPLTAQRSPSQPQMAQASASAPRPAVQAAPQAQYAATQMAQPAQQAAAVPLQPRAAPAASAQARPAPQAHAPQSAPANAPPTGRLRAPTGSGVDASVPIGPNGMPRLESEVGVHSETNFFTDFLGDIRNHGGIFVATFHVMPIGSQCEVLLTFPGNLTAEIRGVVRWKRENVPGESSATSPGIGVEITQCDKSSWDLIDRFIRKREPIMHEM